MRKEDMRKKVDAGELPVEVSIEKYRELQCRILDDEEITIDDIQGTTCALCYAYGDNFDCSSCPLHLAGYSCRISGSVWRELYDLINHAAPKQQILDAIDNMIAALKESRDYEKEPEPKESEEEASEKYIEGERDCGLAVGNIVKVTRTAESHEKGWGNGWVEDKMFAGKTGKIISIRSEEGDSASGIEVEVDGDWWAYPYFVLEKVEKTYHIGQHFLHSGGDEYLLARIESKTINLFNLSSGGKWSTSIKISDDTKITEEEMKELADRLGQWKDFTLVEE